MTKFLLNCCLLLFVHFDMHLFLNLSADSETLKGETVKLVCSIDPLRFTTFIFLSKNDISKTSCDNANNCNPVLTDSGRYRYSSNSSSVTVEITSLNHTSDSGSWKCKLGTTEEQKYELLVLTKPTVVEQTIPGANNSMLVKNIKVSGKCYCIFPPVTKVELYYRIDNGEFQHLQAIPYSSINNSLGCEPYEFEITVTNYTVENSKTRGFRNVFFKMHFGDYTTNFTGPFHFEGLTTPASTSNSDIPTRVSEGTSPSTTTSSAGLTLEMLIAIIISSTLVAGGLCFFLIILVLKLCRQKCRETPAKSKKKHFANKQDILNNKANLKPNTPRKSKFLEKRNTKQESTTLEKRPTLFKNSVPCDSTHQHYPQIADYWNKCGNQHVFNNSYTGENMMLYGNLHENQRQYHSHNQEQPGHNEGMLQYYRAGHLFRGQKLYQMSYALHDKYIKDKLDSKRSSDRRPYESNWNMLY